MSWAQRRDSTRSTAAITPPMQMYNPNQHSNSEWQSTTQPWSQQQQPPHQDINQRYWQQPLQPYPMPTQTPNANTGMPFQQHQQPDQAAYYQNSGGMGINTQQQAYGNVQYSQNYDQNNIYGGPRSVQHQPLSEVDTWGTWGWGEDDNNSNAQAVVSQQPQNTTNQSIGDSFSNDESWNWSLIDSQRQRQTGDESKEQNVSNIFPTIGDLKSKSDNHLLGNRKKLETPQWSTESQPSLESSDDILQTSESDKSHIVSRSSTISHSPISGQETFPPGQGVVHLADNVGNSHHQAENKEILKQEMLETRSQHINPAPPLTKNLQAPPLMPPSQGFPDDSKNPYKRASGFPQKSANKVRPSEHKQLPFSPNFNQSVNLETLPDNSEQPDRPLLHSATKMPASAHQSWPQTENNEAPINDRNQYLETGQLSEVNLADGNEASDLGNDTLPPPGLQRMIPGQLEQNEIPGFSRMVLGQNERNSNDLVKNQTQFDLGGPPEGLHRMIPGESSSPENSLRQVNPEENDSEIELTQVAQNNGVQPPRSATIGADTPPIQAQVSSIQTPPSEIHLSSNRSETIGSDLAVSIVGDLSDNTQSTGMLSIESRNHKHSKSKEKLDPQERREAIEGHTSEVSNITNILRNITVGENLTDGHTSNTSVPEQSPRRLSRQESSDSENDRKLSRSNREKRSTEKTKSREKERDKYSGGRDVERDRYKDRNSDRYSPDVYRDKRDGRSRRYKDRRYEEDTDHYSDKDRKGKDDRDGEYERKYNSLRRDKDKRRRERDSRDYRDSKRNDYYYRYSEDYGPENRSSRPSSRSDSLHESYRERRHEPESRERRHRDKERERYRNRDHRDVYNPYQSFAYDPYNPYYQQYQYYENLRRTNPQAYAEWYRKYYQQTTGSTASYTGEDRASVHSGRSSANDELAKERYTRQSFYSQSNYYGQSHSISGHYGLDTSSLGYNRTLDQTDVSLIYDQQQTNQRLTPSKFATAHIKASITSGKLVRILPNYPMDGQNAVVDLCSLQPFLENDPNYAEMRSFPGPLIKGVTHKKQIIEYCDGKIRDAAYNTEIVDVESYVLMWELLILLIRQNGMVVGTDIAELLLKNRNSDPTPRPSSVLSTVSSNLAERHEVSEGSNHPVSEQGSNQSILKEEEVTKKFREFLLYGSCQEALEWAMNHGLWGHALFLASKLDKRTYANIMMRFANGLTINDPLQTLYQLLSGKMPAVVTCVLDEKWGDWRPHLAMILSNSTQRPELNCKAITQLGDTLLDRGSLYAAQFCYLMAEVGFGKHLEAGTKLVLLGSDHRKPFPQFVTNEAVHMTEIYEFACSLNDQGFYINEFQLYKYLLATRLADFGFLQRSLQYLELIANRIILNPNGVSAALVNGVCQLADKLKFYDPVGDVEDESQFGSGLETSRPDNSWLKDLKAIQRDYQSGKLNEVFLPDHQEMQATVITDNTLQESYNHGQDVWQQEQQLYDEQQQLQFSQQSFDPHYQDSSVWTSEQQPNRGYALEENQQPANDFSQYPDQPNYWSGQAQTWGEQYGQNSSNAEQLANNQTSQYYENSNDQQQQKVEKETAPEEQQQQQPQISMPNQPKGKSPYDDEPLPHEKQKNNTPVKPTPQLSKQDSQQQSTGWFGGIFSKLSMRPKNQMKLPDDKNPKIVWDENKKKWINVDEDPNDPATELKPPPKMMEMPQMPIGMGIANLQSSGSDIGQNSFNANVPFNTDQSGKKVGLSGPMSLPAMGLHQEGIPSKPAQSNMFKMQKNRNVKNAYVDVFKQNGVKPNTEGVPLPEQVPVAPPPQTNFFIPQPIPNSDAPMDFLTPGGAPVQIGEPQKK